jgi:putative transposase
MIFVGSKLHHTDQRVQYAATSNQPLLTEYATIPSMSHKGDCYDNAALESFFATLKRELVDFENFLTREVAQTKSYKYIKVFCNRQR